MSIVSAIVLYFVVWFMTLFVALPVGLRTQGDEDNVVPGTHSSSPANFRLWRKLGWVTLIASGIWAVAAFVLLSGAISVADIDFTKPWRPDVGKGG